MKSSQLESATDREKRNKETTPGICPGCGSEDVNFEDVDFQADTNYQECSCNDCDCRWHEIYKFCQKEIIK